METSLILKISSNLISVEFFLDYLNEALIDLCLISNSAYTSSRILSLININSSLSLKIDCRKNYFSSYSYLNTLYLNVSNYSLRYDMIAMFSLIWNWIFS